MNRVASYLSDMDLLQQPSPTNRQALDKQSGEGQLAYADYSNLIKRQTENRLLNTQARIEYELLKSNILAGVTEMNKFLDMDDQISIHEYKMSTSLRYRKQFFFMEFKQLPIDNNQCNHALDLIFQGSNVQSGSSGKTTLTLIREHNQFIWRQLHSVLGGPGGASKVLVRLILLWLQDEQSIFIRFAPI